MYIRYTFFPCGLDSRRKVSLCLCVHMCLVTRILPPGQVQRTNNLNTAHGSEQPDSALIFACRKRIPVQSFLGAQRVFSAISDPQSQCCLIKNHKLIKQFNRNVFEHSEDVDRSIFGHFRTLFRALFGLAPKFLPHQCFSGPPKYLPHQCSHRA